MDFAPSQNCIELISHYEGCKLTQYICPAGVSTIGFGTTLIDGKPVQSGLKITLQKAKELLLKDLRVFSNNVNGMVINKSIKQNQFDALVSFAYNVGSGALKSSTLLKKVNANPNDVSIKDEFLKWTKAGGKELEGLKKRRMSEALLYMNNELIFA